VPISAIRLIENVYNSAMTISVEELINGKLDTIISSDAAIPASSNIGCSMHIANGLREKIRLSTPCIQYKLLPDR